MDRLEIVKEIKKLQEEFGISVHDVVVSYEAAAVMHGIRHSVKHVELDVHDDDFIVIREKHCTNRGSDHVGLFATINGIDFHVGEHHEYEMIDDVWVVTRDTLLRQYRKLFNSPNRPDDKRKKDMHVIKTLNMR